MVANSSSRAENETFKEANTRDTKSNFLTRQSELSYLQDLSNLPVSN